jgi:hypothetical protein
MLALSGIAFAVLLVLGWFLRAGDAPDYHGGQRRGMGRLGRKQPVEGGIDAFLMLLAGVAFLHFAGTMRSVLGRAETTVRGSLQQEHVAFAGAITDIVGITIAIVMIGAATSIGADAELMVSRAATTASAGPYLVATMGFATLFGFGAADAANLSLRAFGPR